MVRFIVTVSLLMALATWNFPRFQQWQHDRSGASLAQHHPKDCEYEAEKTAAIEHVAANLDRDNGLKTSCN